jgi:hypothetical protein
MNTPPTFTEVNRKRSIRNRNAVWVVASVIVTMVIAAWLWQSYLESSDSGTPEWKCGWQRASFYPVLHPEMISAQGGAVSLYPSDAAIGRMAVGSWQVHSTNAVPASYIRRFKAGFKEGWGH